MSESRFVTLDQKYNDCLEKSKQYWEHKGSSMAALSSRAFNPFQHLELIDPVLIKQLCNEYLSLPRSKHSAWAQKAIHIACQILLEKEGVLKSEWVKYLHWREYPACYIHDRVKDLVCSYVNIILLPALLDALAEKDSTKKLVLDLAQLFSVKDRYADWVRDEIDLNFSHYDSGFVEKAACEFSKVLLSEEKLDERSLKKTDIWLFEEKKFDRKTRQAFWLEVITRNANNEKFKLLWDFFSVRINPMRDEPHLSQYQRDQYRFCRRHFAKLIPATNILIPIAYPVASIQPGPAVEMMPIKKELANIEIKSEEPDLDTYVVVDNDGPTYEYLQTFSLFNYVTDSVAQATTFVTHKLGVGSSDS